MRAQCVRDGLQHDHRSLYTAHATRCDATLAFARWSRSHAGWGLAGQMLPFSAVPAQMLRCFYGVSVSCGPTVAGQLGSH